MVPAFGRRSPVLMIHAPLHTDLRQCMLRKFTLLAAALLVHASSIAVVHQHFNGKLKVELRPPAPEEVLVSREKARAFKDWLDGVR